MQLLAAGYLKEEFHFTPYATISYIVPGQWGGAAGGGGLGGGAGCGGGEGLAPAARFSNGGGQEDSCY